VEAVAEQLQALKQALGGRNGDESVTSRRSAANEERSMDLETIQGHIDAALSAAMLRQSEDLSGATDRALADLRTAGMQLLQELRDQMDCERGRLLQEQESLQEERGRFQELTAESQEQLQKGVESLELRAAKDEAIDRTLAELEAQVRRLGLQRDQPGEPPSEEFRELLHVAWQQAAAELRGLGEQQQHEVRP